MVKLFFHKYLDALLAPDIAYDHPHHRSSVAVTQEFGLHHDRIPPGRGWIQLVLVTTRAVVAVNGTLSFQKGGHWALCWVLPTGWNNNVVGICWHILYNLSKMLERHVPFCFQALWWAVALQRFATFQQFLWCKEYPLLEGAVYMEMSGQCRVLSQTATVPSMSFGALFFPENGWLLVFLWTKTNGEYYIHFDNIHLGHFV